MQRYFRLTNQVVISSVRFDNGEYAWAGVVFPPQVAPQPRALLVALLVLTMMATLSALTMPSHQPRYQAMKISRY